MIFDYDFQRRDRKRNNTELQSTMEILYAKKSL